MYFLESSDYLADLSFKKVSFQLLQDQGIVSQAAPEGQHIMIIEKERNVQNYIDPNTGRPYDPFRTNSDRGRKLALLRKLRAVLP